MNAVRKYNWTLRLSDVEMKQIKAAGARFDLKPSEWARAVLMRSLLVDPRDATDPRPDNGETPWHPV